MKAYSSIIDCFLDADYYKVSTEVKPEFWKTGPRTIAAPADWRNKAAKAENTNILEAALPGNTADATEYQKYSLTDEQIKKRIHDLLNDGWKPSKVAAAIDKLAENVLFNKQMATTYLQQQAGVLGLAFLQPNAYMNDCRETHDRMVNKLGSIQAVTVKKIAACNGCALFDKVAQRCNLYKRPVISTPEQLRAVVNKLAKGAKNKKAALVNLANHTTERPENTTKAITGKAREKMIESPKTAVPKFSADIVAKLASEGKTLEEMYKYGCSKVGSVNTGKAIRAYINNLKASKSKIALTQIDCGFLKGKLASSNGIVGASKCANCIYRRDMHCSYTGGTLIGFPGMNKTKTASVESDIGTKLLNEFQLGNPELTITPISSSKDTISMGNKPEALF